MKIIKWCLTVGKPASLGHRLVRISAWFISTALYFSPVIGQLKVATNHDTSYYETYYEDLIARFYFSRKYTSLELKKDSDVPDIKYRPNINLNAGIGFTYRTLSLNVAYGFPFLNNDDEKGKTKHLDLQTRVYTRKWAIDLYGQFYKEFYIKQQGRDLTGSQRYYIRPDLKISLGGISAYRLFNYKRFSLRQAFVQDEWQKKSAGSILAGAEVHYGLIKADSTLVPGELDSYYHQGGITKSRIIEIGPGAGYAYTQVLPFRLFLTGSFIMNVNVSLVQENGGNKTDRFGLNADMLYRFAAGYNDGNWNINFFRVSNLVSAKGARAGIRYVLDTGIYRVTVSKRLHPGVKAGKLLKPIDRIMGSR